jgi:oxygen-independent coproporphyrinogen-3 oxidase
MPGVYISYPFCAQKCTYCNFASGVFPSELEPQYIDALVSELAAHAWNWQPETIYLGGGTPSGMATGDLNRILRSLPDGRGSEPRASASGSRWREATIEVAPGTVTCESSAAWASAGINRVSLGVQSFVQRELARTGRKHTAEIVEREVALLRSSGLANINIDLIAGLPGQTRASWQESLAWIERLQPPHVSVYMLEIDEDSRLGNEVLLNGKRYGAPDVPSDELTAELYESAVAELARMGTERYEISNFARAGFESLHNLKYWRLEPYAGFGADAHSLDGAARSQNIESPSEYVAKIQSGGSACIGKTPANHAEERFFVGLRLTQGVLLQPEEWRKFEQPIQRFLADGLLERDHERLRLTDRGVLFSNEVFAEFITI